MKNLGFILIMVIFIVSDIFTLYDASSNNIFGIIGLTLCSIALGMFMQKLA